jgi:Carbohydrate esterase, sialic acid-specific acetylesterase
MNHRILLATALLIHPAAADVRLPALFSDHMVIQQDHEVPVWGWASPGEAVSVAIAGLEQKTTADAKGKWSVKLGKLPAKKEAAALTVKGKNEIIINDVLIGEVWLASGQSNMQMPVNGVRNKQQEINQAKFPAIRMFTVERKTAETPQEECGGKWVVCSPETVMHFSATAYFFGREIHKTREVPVGLINASWGGTPIEAWTSMEVQKDTPALAPILASWKQKTSAPFNEKQAMQRYEKQKEAWQKNVEKAKAEGKRPPPQAPRVPMAPRLQPNHPANLFNGMIAPLVPYAIRGAIWYQGESNSNGPLAKLYQKQLPLLIEDWRKRWNQGDFHFGFVQLPGFKKIAVDPNAPSGWAIIREAMLKTLALKNTGMAIVIDAGEADNIHPKDKQTVGKRLSQWALAEVYDMKIPSSGPLPAGHEIRGNEVLVSFTHADGGLTAKSGDLKGFAIAGADRRWIWAKAHIDGDEVVVSHPDVKQPLAVRYSWADHPDCNLTNGAGLPASPFRTDDW